jgi:hypothetical protein
MHVQITRIPALGGQIGRPLQPLLDPLRLSRTEAECAGLARVLGTALDLERIIARRQGKLGRSRADEMIGPSGQLREIVGIASMVLHMDAARKWVLILADNNELDHAVARADNARFSFGDAVRTRLSPGDALHEFLRDRTVPRQQYEK